MRGVVAAGHPLTAEAGAQVLRAGGNAVDAALAAMVASFVAEPQLTGLGAGGYMLVAEPGEAPALLDFFVAAPGDGADPSARAPLVAGRGVLRGRRPGLPRRRGVVRRLRDAGRDLRGAPALRDASRSPTSSRPRAALARAGVEINAQQAYIFALLEPITASTPGGAREVLDRRPRGARGRRARRPRARRHARAARRGGRGAVLHRRHRARGVRARRRARRHADARRTSRATRRSRASRSASATAATTSSPTRRRRPAGS